MLARSIAERNGSGPVIVEPSRLSMADSLAEWLASKKSELAPDTHRRYAGIVERCLKPALGALKLTELGRAHVEHLVSRLRSDKLQPGTIRHVLSAALNQAVVWELRPSNPATSVKRLKDRSQKIQALSEDEAARLMAAVRGTRREVLYDVALTLGQELRGLDWPDLSGSMLTIAHSISTDYGIEWGPTKTGEERALRLPRRLVDALRRHRKAQLEQRASASTWEDPTLIFPNTRGGIWRDQGMHVAFKRDFATAGLSKEVRFHDSRRTAPTLMLKKRVP